ncbi:MAG: GAF domain-containing protein [Candidatus Marinimicrobia bacterium]|nr:GAF domain-containing protein [Candidatus Neomarinimicrobiota bacterium]|tara:strand:- start:9 stop:2267 length:2259 start_codon:yes stop_codon:yes gene_type:complete
MGSTTTSRKKIVGSDKFAQLLLNVNNDLAATKSLDNALETLVGITTSTIGAERGTIFLNNEKTGELYSRVAQGNFMREIRIMNTRGVAGWVYTNQKGAIILDAYKDDRFDKSVDMRTGYRTKNILCTPLRTVTGETIGVSQLLNKSGAPFNEQDLEILEAMTKQAAIALQSHIALEAMEASRKQELEFLDVVSQISSELELSSLLSRIVSTITTMLDAERSSLFINDEKTSELYTEVGEGLGKNVIRFPNHLGIAGTVFTSGEILNIPHCYADLRFNPAFDKQTGYFTRSMLCAPVTNKDGKIIGVSQVLNKRGGSFSSEDEARLVAFTSQISIGIENAALFDNVQNLMNYNMSMLSSMSNGVITINEDSEIETCNDSGLRIMKLEESQQILKQKATDFFKGENEWILSKLENVEEGEYIPDAELTFENEKISTNVSIVPLKSTENESLGTMIMLEDISNEKRMKSTMSRYMDADLAEQLMDGGEGLLGGQESIGTVLFSDIRSFTTLTEELGAQGTVALLNEYFTIMVDCVQNEGGMLDKFIGDAMMAIFGTPFPHDDDPDRAVRAAIAMMNDLNDYNMRRAKEGKLPIDHGMGLNTDNIMSGNIGSPKRMDYTVIGDGVNLAARVESACKKYGAHILTTEYSFKAFKATYRTRQVDNMIVKGKTKPVKVYEVLDYHTKESFPNMIEVLEMFNNGMEFYNEAKWDDAIKYFKKAEKANPKDKASIMYIDRCTTLKKQNPKDWNGVWVSKSK